MKTSSCIDDVAGRLGCSRQRADGILHAVMRALRDGLDDREAATIESSLPADLRAIWPRTASRHQGLADLGDVGFLGRVHELASSPSDEETMRMVHVVLTTLMIAMAIPGNDRRAVWSALTHLPRESKLVWMKLFRASCFPVELYASDL
ncbi:MAG TPA: DUF2267 domain-containing protein [Candidatus Binatus sp.]|nr:DUF2267 domain-containing protein [Candidatus Binatus sp.]